MPFAKDPSDWIDDGAREGPGRPFLCTLEGRELSYAGLADRIACFASALSARGVAPGDRVAAQVDKSVDAVLLYLACLDLGAVFVPINVANTGHEVDYFLRDSGPRLAVVRPSSRTVLEPVALKAQINHVETLGADGEGSLPELVNRCAGAARPARRCGADSLAAIVYTSGTTGRSKGAMLTRGNLASNAEVLAEAWRFTENDVLLHALPLFHVHGLFVAINTVLASKSSLLLLPKFDAATVLRSLAVATVYMGVPTHYTRLLQEPALDRTAAAGMRLFISGSAPLLAETHREFSRRTGHRIIERYGMTETLMNSSNPYEGARVPGSVGPALPGVSIRVSDAADGIGGLEIKGPNVFAGYWGDTEKTGAAFTSDGWFKTGDVGRLGDEDRIGDEDYVYIMGRAKDLVISGGYNVYPKEVETELDAVTGVLESAVFGVAHPDFGEGVTAAVVREPGTVLSEADIIGAVKTRLAGYKIPKRILFLDDLPRNAMGKVQKNALRSTFAKLYQMTSPALKLLSSMAVREVLREMTSRYQADTACAVNAEAAGGVDVAKRVQGGESVDVVVLASNAIDKLIEGGKLLAGSRVDLVYSGIAIAIRANSPKPGVGTEEEVKKAVLAAGSLSYSTGPSGVYLENLFERWGILETIRNRIVVPPPGVAVGSLVANGTAELGFQQWSELKNVPNVEVVGPLPAAIQSMTTFSGAVSASCADPAAAGRLLAFMASPVTAAAKLRHGMEPAAARA